MIAKWKINDVHRTCIFDSNIDYVSVMLNNYWYHVTNSLVQEWNKYYILETVLKDLRTTF